VRSAGLRAIGPCRGGREWAYVSSVVDAIAIEANPVRQTAAVELLAVVADPVRWRLVAELARCGTRCVCDLQPVGGVAPNVLSYHLKVLREAGLVTAQRRGRWADYTLAPDAPERLRSALPGARR
jgi:ArsR family transcriptional regulator